MLAITIISLLCLGLLFSILASAHSHTVKSNNANKGVDRLYGLFYILILFVSVSVIVLYIK